MTVNTFLRSLPFLLYSEVMEGQPTAPKPNRQGRAYTVYLPVELLAQLQDYRWKQRHPSLKAAMVDLLRQALEQREAYERIGKR